MKPEWQKFVTKMKRERNINVADIESKVIPQMKEKPQIMGYPTIKYYHNNKDVAEHSGDRTCNGFEQFKNQNIGQKVAKPEPKKQYPTLGDTLGDVDSNSGPMDNILKLFSAKLDGNKPMKAPPVKAKKTKKATPSKAKKTKKTKKTKKATPSKAKKTKKTKKAPAKPKKTTPTKAKKTRKSPSKPKDKPQPKIKPINPVLKNKERKTTTEREIKLHTNIQVVKTPQQIKADRKREKRKEQRTKKREQQQPQQQKLAHVDKIK